jgi:predicted  nucleic acid-binding Zn-ribbon protein
MIHKCKQCGYEWEGRKPRSPRCPKCHIRYWRRPPGASMDDKIRDLLTMAGREIWQAKQTEDDNSKDKGGKANEK